jgi:hypothetical protein
MAIGIGIGLQYSRVVGGLSAEALAWQTRIIANGGTISAEKLAIFDQKFFKPALANGYILTEADRLNFYAGLIGYEIAARTNLIKSAHFVTPISSPIFDNNGYRSGGTGYLNLNYIPSSQGVKFGLNNNIMFAGVLTPAFVGTKATIGCRSSGTRLDLIRSTTLSAYNNTPSNDNNTNVSSSGVVFLATKRTGADVTKNIINGNELAGTIASVSLPTNSCLELTNTDTGGAPAGNYDDRSHYYSGHCSSNFDHVGFQVIISGLITALGL